MSDAAATADGHHHGSPFIQHHFDDGAHQFDSGKLGIWLFLAQEVLFFSALFVAYIVFRYNHPEVFLYANKYLDTTMGAVNTCVLIVSSLTAAWGVRCAQLNQKRGLIICLVITILCAFGFLGVKYVEYSHKAHIGTVFGKYFQPTEDSRGRKFTPEQKKAAAAGAGSAELEAAMASVENVAPEARAEVPPPNTSMFFSIYFAMTGLHGIHVLAGIFVFIWLLRRAIRGDFNSEYYGPIDFAALYWHLVDLIWIFLFPMLYLIH